MGKLIMPPTLQYKKRVSRRTKVYANYNATLLDGEVERWEQANPDWMPVRAVTSSSERNTTIVIIYKKRWIEDTLADREKQSEH